jgi:DNA repair exonuclease SbcCD nuclease subunit
MRELTIEAFKEATKRCITEAVDFVLIAGDLFHTALPSIDSVKAVFRALRELKEAGIPVYFITGSHDYSPTGKTMLDVVEEAALGTNVFRGHVENGVLTLHWTHDPKTKTKITGILGRANQLDTEIYESIDREALAKELGIKIFLFHTSLEELTPGAHVIDTSPLSLLPEGCSYYAGGHVHVRAEENIAGKHIVYPGPLFPASFSELEDLSAGGFVIVNDWQVQRVRIEPRRSVAVNLDLKGIAPMKVQERVLEACGEVKNAIVLVRAHGVLAGKPTDIPWRTIVDELEARGAYVVLRNTVQLTSPELDKTLVSTGSLEEIEASVLREHKLDPSFAKALIDALAAEQQDGEKRSGYEERVMEAALATLAKKP